jgi:hypothetical protein
MPLCLFFLWGLTVAFQNDLLLSGVAHSPRNVAELLFQCSYPKHVSTCGTFGYHLGVFFLENSYAWFIQCLMDHDRELSTKNSFEAVSILQLRGGYSLLQLFCDPLILH